MATEKFCLRWNDFESNISLAFRELRQDKDFFDVTLTCDDEQQLQAHKVILSACSPFFRNVLRRNLHEHPLLYLKGVKSTDLLSVLNFMYHGEVNVAQEELNSFLAVAEDLRVKGLTQNQPVTNTGGSSSNTNSKVSIPPRSPLTGSQKVSRPPDPAGGGSGQPPLKRSRSSLPQTLSAYSQSRVDGGGGDEEEDDDDIQEVVPVKSEPRESATSAAAITPSGLEAGASVGAAVDSSYSNALVSEEGEAYDESYEDYGQYDQSFGGGEGGGDGALVDLGPDGSKVRRLGDGEAIKADLETMLVQNPLGRGYICAVCGKHCGDRSGARNHVEALHLPSSGYNCELCGKFLRTRNALNCHMYRNHSTGSKKATSSEGQDRRDSEKGGGGVAAKVRLLTPDGSFVA